MLTSLTVQAVLVLVASYCAGQMFVKPDIMFFSDNEVVAISVTCRVTFLWPEIRYYTVYILRNGVKLGEATAGSLPVLKQNMTGAYIYGDVSSSITLNITQSTCRDGGEYTCIMEYNPPGESRLQDKYSDKLMVSVQPGKKVAMAVYPKKEEYCLNNSVQLSCRGMIGEYRYFSRIKWIWEYMNYLQNSTWINYTDSNIINDPPLSVKANCQNRQDSYIIRTLSPEDNNRTYRCYLTWDGHVNTVNPPNYTFTFTSILPGQITLTPLPHYTYYEPETVLEMNCSGKVGGTTVGTQIRWVWEYQDYQGSTWNSYMTDSDITPPTPSLPNNSCQNKQVSVLTRKLTLEDSRRTYRCYIHRNGQSYVQFAGMYQIGPIRSTDQNPSNNTDTKQILSTDTGTTTDVEWWIIVVAVVGGALLCVVIGTAVFLKRRNQRKHQKEHIKKHNAFSYIREVTENKPSPVEVESKDDEEILDVPPSNALPMTSYPLLDSMHKKIGGLGTDRESSVDPSEDDSSRSSVSSQEQ